MVFIDMKDIEKQYVKNAYTSGHATTAVYYRLWLQNLLPNLNKILYLDNDVIVKKDLYDLFKTDITNYYVAGIKGCNALYLNQSAQRRGYKSHADALGIPSLDQYINSGVLLINLEKMRKDNILNSFKKLLSKKFPTWDQDIINAVCYNKILFLDLKYNCMQHYLNWSKKDKKYIVGNIIKNFYSSNESEKAYKDPIIVHYSSNKKPWLRKDVPNADLWWNYAKIGLKLAESGIQQI